MPKCYHCHNTGTLPFQIYYIFGDLCHWKFCNCQHGKTAEQMWLKSELVQNAIRAKRQREVERAFKFSEIPKKWQKSSVESLEGQERIKQRINAYLDDFTNIREGRGIYLYGRCGRGKTHTLSTLCHMLIKRYVLPSIFITEEQLYRKIRETFDDESQRESTILEKFKNISCLFIDDLGATKTTEWKQEILTSILDSRLSNSRPTFFTSNFSITEYENRSHKRIGSRLSEICRGNLIEMKGVDYRKKFNS